MIARTADSSPRNTRHDHVPRSRRRAHHPAAAAELMQSHRVDLISGLAPREGPTPPGTLRQALAGLA